MSGTILFICWTLAISALSGVLSISAWSAAPQRWRKGRKNKEEFYKIVAKIKANGDEPGRFCLYKFFICEQSDCVEKFGDTQSPESTEWMFSETWSKIKTKFQSRRSVEFSRMSERCSTWRRYRETCRDRWRPGIPELSGDWRYRETCISRIRRISRKHRNSRKFSRLGNRRQNLASSFSCITRLYLTWRKSSRLCKADLWSKSDGWSEWPKCEYSCMEYICVCYSSSCSSSWTTHDWLEAAYVESRIYAIRAVPVANSTTCVFSDSVLCLGSLSDRPVEAWRECIKCFFLNHAIWIESKVRRWSSSGQFSQDSLHWVISRWDSENDGGIKVWT